MREVTTRTEERQATVTVLQGGVPVSYNVPIKVEYVAEDDGTNAVIRVPALGVECNREDSDQRRQR